MKKTLLLSEIFPPVKGGSGRWFWEVYTRLSPQDVVVAAGQAPQAAELDQHSPLKTYRLPLSSVSWGLKSVTGLKYYWSMYWQLRKLIKQHKLEAIHCGRCLPEGFLAWLLSKTLGIPYLCFIHGEDIETASTSRELSWIVHKALAGANVLIANSQNTADLLAGHWQVPKDKIRVIHPGVDSKQFTPAAPNSEQRAALGWQDKKVILTVGRLQERKGHDMMIKALPALAEQLPDVHYAIIGHGDRRPYLEQLTQQLGLADRVQFLDEIDDVTMIHCYQQCDLFILPNRTVGKDIEGFGMVLVEAQSCAKPVVAGDSGGTSETMIIGTTGLIVDCTQPEKIAAALLPLLQDDQRSTQMGLAGREFVVEHLDWQALSEQAGAVFDNTF